MRSTAAFALVVALVVAACAAGDEGPAAPGVVAGRVTDRATGAAVGGASVWVPGTTTVVTTAADGWFELEAAAGTAALMVAADGYLAVRRGFDPVAAAGSAAVNVRLFPAVTDEATDRLLSVRAAAPRAEDLSGDLRPEARALLDAIAARPDAPTLHELVPEPPATPGRVSFAIDAPPATIRVWRRGLDGSSGSCSGRVDVIAFEQYVKGVLAHEWIPSWEPKSLEMGAVAIRTYAWWWIAAGGKYDCADLDDTTASQVYEDEFLPKTDAAVDATVGVSIIRDGSLVFAEYSAENGDPTEYGVDEPYCAGKTVYGHGRGTCQWGTQRWALNEDKDFVWMSAHYYPGAAANIPGPRYHADFAGESYPQTMVAGEEAVVWLEYVNAGRMTWDTSSTRVGTTEPRDRPSPFYAEGNWIDPTRPSAADHSNYAPGATGRFTFLLRAPEVTETTTFVEHFALVQEGETWFGPEDTFVTWTITVAPKSGNPDPANPGDGVAPIPATPVDPSAAGEPGAPGLFGGCSAAPARRAPTRRPSGAPLTRMAALVLLSAAIWRRGRGFALLGTVLFALGCADTSPAPVPAVARVAVGGDSPLVPLFQEAAAESGVPAEVLATVAFTQTRLRMNLGRDRDHSAPEYGMMALGEGGVSDVHVAAALLGLDAEVVKTDPRANIRAAASALAREAARQGLEPRLPADWAPVVEAYGGYPLAHEVMWRLERGWRGFDDQRRWVVVTARPVGGEYEGISRTSFALGYPGAIWNPANSGNYSAASRGAAQINYVIVHTTQGSYAGAISWFKNSSSNVSAHYVIRSSDGEITQMVDDSDVAWHDACFNSETIGIEHEGWVDDPDTWYTEAMYTASAALTAWLCDQYGIPKDRAHIMGHGEAPDCSSHTDPGGGWNWDHYMDLVLSGGVPVWDAGGGGADYPIVMTSGDEGVAWFEFVNNGNTTWGLDETRLGTQDPADRSSPFFVDGNWLSPSRATGADHSNYGPGATGRFTFAIRAPEVTTETTFVESFQLVQEGVTWFGPMVTMTITVKPRIAPPPPEDPADPIEPGQPGVEPIDPTQDPSDGMIGGGCTVARNPRGGAGFPVLLGCAMLVLGASLLRSRRR